METGVAGPARLHVLEDNGREEDSVIILPHKMVASHAQGQMLKLLGVKENY